MKNAIFGFLLVLAGIVLGVYVGLWLMFIGGIIQVIDAINANPTPALDVALGVCRIVFAGGVGWLSALLLIIPGVAMISTGE